MKVTNIELNVPSLGSITGLCLEGQICQYLGVPYASVPGRFRRPKPSAKPWPNNRWDGTKLGPMCPQPPRDFVYVPNPARPWVENPSMSSKDCLNLNISVPTAPDIAKGMPIYPVMVFVHGGAFVYGAGSAAIYDGRKLAEISQNLAIPTIIVTLTYRVGLFGFLASKEIKEYNQEFGEGGVGNYGLWDQIEALKWIQEHISAFGGDPSRVTFFGQSAGGVSANVHLLRSDRLFSAAIMQSGLLRCCGVLSEEQYQVVYEKVLDVLEVPVSLHSKERLQQLIATEESKLNDALVQVGMIPVLTLSPCDDHFLIPDGMPSYSDFSDFKAPAWCERLMIGDVKHETLIWNKSFRALDASAVVQKIKSFIKNDEVAQKLMDYYQITPTMNRSDTFYKIEKLATDGLFLAMHWAVLRSNPKMYAYRFDTPSPFHCDFQALAHHSLDNVFVWGLLKDILPSEQQAISAKMSEAWLRFANNQEPWERFDKNQELMIFGPTNCRMRSVSDDASRGYAIWEAIERDGLSQKLGELADELCMHHEEMCDALKPPKAIETESFEAYAIKTGKNSGGVPLF